MTGKLGFEDFMKLWNDLKTCMVGNALPYRPLLLTKMFLDLQRTTGICFGISSD